MKYTYSISLLMLLASCGPNKTDEMLPIDAIATGGKCEYSASQDVILEHRERVPFEDGYKVTFIVTEKNGKQLIWTAKLGKDCSDEFVNKGQIGGKLERIQHGTCSPVVITPDNYNPACWQF